MFVNRRDFFYCLTGLVAFPSRSDSFGLIDSISKHTVRRNRSGSGTTWFHPRACMIPNKTGSGTTALMTLQAISGSDYFGPVHWSVSTNSGRSWTEPDLISAFARSPVPERPGLEQGVCDVVPEFHPMTGTVLALGHVVFYRGDRFATRDQLARYPIYAVRRPDGTWSSAKRLVWADPRGSFIYTNNCGQRIVLPNGDILLAFSFGEKSDHRSVAGVLCSFDGEDLRVKEVGPELKHPHQRGLLEPSLTQFGGRFFITIRAEDDRGYVSASTDGLHWEPKKAWKWDDGEPVNMSSTQQHWLAHSDGLFLVYTRKQESNLNVIRWRAPLFLARVDTENYRLIRKSERVVLPLVGDGVDDPDGVALMGNFHVTNAGPYESWITVGEWMPRRGVKGDLLLGRVTWNQQNKLAL